MAQLQRLESDISYELKGRPGTWSIATGLFGDNESVKTGLFQVVDSDGAKLFFSVELHTVSRNRTARSSMYTLYGILDEPRDGDRDSRWVTIYCKLTNSQGRVIVTDEMPFHPGRH